MKNLPPYTSNQDRHSRLCIELKWLWGNEWYKDRLALESLTSNQQLQVHKIFLTAEEAGMLEYEKPSKLFFPLHMLSGRAQKRFFRNKKLQRIVAERDAKRVAE